MTAASRQPDETPARFAGLRDGDLMQPQRLADPSTHPALGPMLDDMRRRARAPRPLPAGWWVARGAIFMLGVIVGAVMRGA